MRGFYASPDIQVLPYQAGDVLTASQNEEFNGTQEDFFVWSNGGMEQ